MLRRLCSRLFPTYTRINSFRQSPVNQCVVENRSVGTYLLDIISRPNIHDHVLQVAQLPWHIKRVCEGYQDRLVCELDHVPESPHPAIRWGPHQQQCHTPLFAGFTSVTFSMQALNFACACLSWVNEVVNWLSSCIGLAGDSSDQNQSEYERFHEIEHLFQLPPHIA